MWNRRFVLALLFYACDLAFVLLPRLAEATGRERLRWVVYTAIVALFAALSLIILWRRSRDPRVAMFALVGVMIALYFVPASVEWGALTPGWRPAILLAFGFMYTFDFAIYIHVSSIIPTPNPIAFSRRWFIPAHYAAAVVLSIVIGLLLNAEFEPSLRALVPGDPMEAAESLLRVRSMYAALMMIVLLGSRAAARPRRGGVAARRVAHHRARGPHPVPREDEDPAVDAVVTSDDLASVAERHSPFLRDAEVAESPALRQTLDAIGARCFIPIDHRGARIGFVTLGDLTTGPLDLDRDDLQRLESIAATASVMLENSRLVELATVGGPS